MTQSLTVFVVGAGASVDFGFPDGKKLQKRICEILRPGHSYEDGVHGCLVHNFEEIRARGMQVDQHFYKHCEWMAETIPLYPSIDSFLDKNSRPGDVTSFIGKLAIGHIIADHEANSDLAKQRGQAVNWEALSKTWMGRLWALANVGGSANKVENTLPDIAFVTFNYDRCIEQFLASAIAQTQNIKFDDALKSAANVPCEHVYGSLGVLGLQEVVSEFGSARHPANAGALVDRIKTFTEQIDSETSLRIDSLLKRATRIIFLGFSFGAYIPN